MHTGVEMKAGQTLALAGLIQTRIDAKERGLPFLSDLPYIGAAFRSVEEVVNEIELLIIVTPELVDALDPHEVPHGGPGRNSAAPNDCQLYGRGHIEVPYLGPNGGCVSCRQNEEGVSCPTKVSKANRGAVYSAGCEPAYGSSGFRFVTSAETRCRTSSGCP